MVWAESTCLGWVSNPDDQEVGAMPQVVDAYRDTHGLWWGWHRSPVKNDSEEQGQNRPHSPLCLQPWGEAGSGKACRPFGAVPTHERSAAASFSDMHKQTNTFKRTSQAGLSPRASLLSSAPANRGNCCSASGQHIADMLREILTGWGDSFSWEWINFYWSFLLLVVLVGEHWPRANYFCWQYRYSGRLIAFECRPLSAGVTTSQVRGPPSGPTFNGTETSTPLSPFAFLRRRHVTKIFFWRFFSVYPWKKQS